MHISHFGYLPGISAMFCKGENVPRLAFQAIVTLVRSAGPHPFLHHASILENGIC